MRLDVLGFHGQDGFGPGLGFVEAARAQQVVPRSDLDSAVIRQQVCGAHVFREGARQITQLLLGSGESETRRSKPTVDLDRIAILDGRLGELAVLEVGVPALEEALFAGLRASGATSHQESSDNEVQKNTVTECS